MSATSILKARSLIKRLNKSEMETLTQKVLNMSTTSEVKAAIEAAVN
jgi:phosphotransferase system enzyme I (PtsI)